MDEDLSEETTRFEEIEIARATVVVKFNRESSVAWIEPEEIRDFGIVIGNDEALLRYWAEKV